MRVSLKSLSFAAAIALCTGTAVADGHLEGAVSARQAVMKLYAFNLGQLGAMARGKAEYNAEAAAAAAGNLKALTSLNQMAMWPQGSDNGAMGDKTRALPAIWAEFPKVAEISKTFGAAVDGLNNAAGNDLDSLKAALGPVGKACGACHEPYRAEKK